MHMKAKSEYEWGDFFQIGTDPLETLYDYVTAPDEPGMAVTPISDESYARRFFSSLATAFCKGQDVITGEQLTPFGEPLGYGQKFQQIQKLIDYEQKLNALLFRENKWLEAIAEEPDEKLIAAITNLGIASEIGACAGLEPDPTATTPQELWVRPAEPQVGALGGAAPMPQPMPAATPGLSTTTWLLIGGAAIGGLWWLMRNRGGKKTKKRRRRRR
jgi:hypothetical protein